MGKVFSIASSRITRSINRFNVENRAHKIISQDKPIPAPKHEATIKEMDMMMSEYADEFEKMKIKDVQLDEHLRKVYVVSHDPEPVNRNFGKPSDKNRMPINRSPNIDSELGYMEPLFIQEGKVTLKQAMKFIADHQGDPEHINAKHISDEYKISSSDAANILTYFKSFQVHLPEKNAALGSGKILGPLKISTEPVQATPKPPK